MGNRTKFLGNKKVPFDIKELLKDVDVDKVAFINDASHNLQQTAESYQVYEKLFNEHNTTKYGVAPFSRHVFKEHLPQEVVDFIDGLGFTKYGCNLLIQYPGECSPLHYDLFLYQQEINENTTKEDYNRYVIFLNDRVIGQFFHTEDIQVDWKIGDMYYQDTNVYHGAGNISSETRYTIIIDSLKSLHPFDYQEVVV
jgi:hypothetical protein